MHIILQYIYAARNALFDGGPVIVAQTTVCATDSYSDSMPVKFLTS